MTKIGHQNKHVVQSEKRPAIYQIINLVNGKTYVGSTYNWHERKRNHIRELKKQRHHSEKLQRAWNKYGEKCFEFEVILYLDKDNNVLQKYEQFYIDSFDSFYNGYNCSLSTKHCRLENPWNKGIKMPMQSGKNHHGAVKVVCLNDKKEIVGKYETIREASISMKCSSSSIHNALNGRNKTCLGFYWVRLDDYESGNYEIIKPKTKTIKKPVIKLDKIGNKIAEYPSIWDCALSNNETSRYVSMVCSGACKTIRGYVYQFKEDYEKNGFRNMKHRHKKSRYAYAYDKDWNLIMEFDNITKASEFFNKKSSAITHVIDNPKKTAWGYHWTSKKV